MADSHALVWPICHVKDHPDNTAIVYGWCDVDDREIARWCAEHGLTLVTTDSDFTTRWVKSGVLAAHGVEVIVFTQDLNGLREQHVRVGKHLPHWIETLGHYPYGYRVWEQGHANAPKLRIGRRTPRTKRR